MNIVINQGNQKYYSSIVFGRYKGVGPYNYRSYYIVYNEDKTSLVKVYALNQKVVDRLLEQQTMVYNEDVSEWDLDEGHFGQMKQFTQEELHQYVEMGTVPNKSRFIDDVPPFELHKDYEITTREDIENFYLLSGELHDAIIHKIDMVDDELSIEFEGAWACDIKVILSKDVSYILGVGDYWFTCSIIQESDYYYLVDVL